MGALPDDPVSIELIEPLVLTYVDRDGLDPSRTVTIEIMYGYGLLMDDCRPNNCYE